MYLASCNGEGCFMSHNGAINSTSHYNKLELCDDDSSQQGILLDWRNLKHYCKVAINIDDVIEDFIHKSYYKGFAYFKAILYTGY